MLERTANAEAIINSIKSKKDQQLAQIRIATHLGDFEKAAAILESLLETSPEDPDVWFAGYALASNSPDPNLAKFRGDNVRERLSATHRDIFDGMKVIKSSATDGFKGMKEIEERLAKISPADPAYVMAMAQRIDWRLRDESTGTRKERGSTCLKLIDDVLPYALSSKFVVYRLNAAVLAGRPNIALTTAQDIASKASLIKGSNEEDDDKFAGESPDELKKYLQHCLTVIGPLERDPRIEVMRFYGVRYFINETLTSLDTR